MNQPLKGLLKVIVFISIVLIIAGSAWALILFKLDMPVEWIKTGFLAVMIGAAGLGIAIALWIHSIPNQERFRENPLQAKAWKDLGVYLYSMAIGSFSFYYILKNEGEERNMLMVILAAVMCIWFPISEFTMKMKLLRGLDERERLIHEKAKAISDSVFGSFCIFSLLGLWGWFGGKTPIPVYIPVLMVLGLGLIAEIIKQILILVQCKMEQADE